MKGECKLTTPNNTPIKNRIGAVFIPVRNLEKAIEWYLWKERQD